MTTAIPYTSENVEEKVTTVIADDLHIKGTITFATSLMIKGTLEGEIISEGLLVVGPTAKIEATIVTKSLVSQGEIKGDVTASEQVVLKETAVQTGNITTPYIIVENGSTFNGSCVMKRERTETRGLDSTEGAARETGNEGLMSETIETTAQAEDVPETEGSSASSGYGQSMEPDEGFRPDVVKETAEAEEASAAVDGSTSSDYGYDQPGKETASTEDPGQNTENEEEAGQKTKEEGGSEFSLRSKWRKRELF